MTDWALMRRAHSLRIRIARRIVSQKFGFSASSIYGPEFFVGPGCSQTTESAERIAAVLLDVLEPASVFEFGCGHGALLGALASRGVPAFGCDGSRHGVAMCPTSVFAFQADLRVPFTLNRKFDYVLCIEVAEHLPATAARGLVTMLAETADRGVLFAASGPGEPGDDHINLQPPDYWRGLFVQHGLSEDEAVSGLLVRRLLGVGAPDWYKHTVLFRRIERADHS